MNKSSPPVGNINALYASNQFGGHCCNYNIEDNSLKSLTHQFCVLADDYRKKQNLFVGMPYTLHVTVVTLIIWRLLSMDYQMAMNLLEYP
jgi:phosphatidylserine synthase